MRRQGVPCRLMTPSIVLLLACADRPGIVSRVSGHIAGLGGNILRAEQSESVADSRFYQRIHFNTPDPGLHVDRFKAGFESVAQELGAEWSAHSLDVPQKTAILVSRQPHCLLDLLGRWRVGDIPTEITGVISNHEDARDIAEGFGLPFHLLPVTSETREDQEESLEALLRDEGVELVVLARYMQILSNSFVERWEAK
jgi:formyltetrahydrofolate deformylase